MEIKCAEIGPEGGHKAGRQLLQKMYEEIFGKSMPEILVTERGKPYFQGNPVHFSISHTKKHVFCVLSDLPVGIDAEEMDRDIRLKLSDKILSPFEKEQYTAAENKNAALLRFWVLKEAAAKCTGEGLQGYPNDTKFSLDDPRIFQMNDCFVAVIEAP